ncbi:MAG: SBBP repeat-containing protein [Deltaproteobacteria bacterium]|nr:SBBP repeat-containing protein [Deltaproteobacteria bacterium]
MAAFSPFGHLEAQTIIPMASPDNQRVLVEGGYGQIPLFFIKNQGQLDPRVDYYFQGRHLSGYFHEGGLTLVLNSRSGRPDFSPSPAIRPVSFPGNEKAEEGAKRWIVKLDFVGGDPGVRPEGELRTDGTVSYFRGKPEQWHTGLPTFRRLVYRNLWPGIDLIYQGTFNKMKYEFLVHPGADPGRIRLAYRGADVSLTDAGQLKIGTPLGELLDDAPVAYQDIDGKRIPVSMSYVLGEPLKQDRPARDASHAVAFKLSPYDANRPLVLDPAWLIYCGYIGGAMEDRAYAVAVDKEGHAYVTGYTRSSQEDGFPVIAGPDLTYNGVNNQEVFVAKVKPDGTGLVYSGYIGGTNNDWANGIAVDEAGNAYVTGTTNSNPANGFPVLVGPDLTMNSASDAFVAKINAAGTDLIYCGYIGGANTTWGSSIAVDGNGSAYVVGRTLSTEASFPVTGGPDLTYNGMYDAFVAKVKSDGSGLDYCGYIGGALDDEGYGIAVDKTGNAYVMGFTVSSQTDGFPVVAGPDLTHNGSWDIFVSKIKPDGSGFVYSGFIGGAEADYYGNGIAVDGSGSAYVTGRTYSTEAQGFPVSIGPDLTHNGAMDAFVAKVKSDGSGLDYCGYIGGSSNDEGYGIAVDGLGNAYVAGRTSSSETQGFPVAVGPDLTYNGGGDAFVARVKTDGSGLDYCGYLGGSRYEYLYGLALDARGNAYVAGYTASSESQGFPVTFGPDLTYNGGSDDIFVAKIGAFFINLPLILKPE